MKPVKLLAALQARLAQLEDKVARLGLRDEALDHGIEEPAAAWGPNPNRSVAECPTWKPWSR